MSGIKDGENVDLKGFLIFEEDCYYTHKWFVINVMTNG